MGPVATAALRGSGVFGVRLGLQAVSLILVARSLGPSSYASFAAIAGMAFLAGTLSTFGTHLLVLQASSRHEMDAVATSIAPPVTLLAGGVLLSMFTGASYFWLSAGTTFAAILGIGIAEVLAIPLMQLIAADLQGKGRIASSQVLLLGPLVVRCFAALTIYGASAVDPLTIYAIAYAGGVIVLAIGMAAVYAPWILQTRRWRMPAAKQLGSSAAFAAVNLTALGPSEVDKILAPRLLDASSAGIYAAGSRVVGAALGPVVALMIAAAPRLFRQQAKDPGCSEDAPKFERALLAASGGLGVVLGLGLWCCSNVLDWVFGTKYLGIGSVVDAFAIVVPLAGLRIATGNLVMTSGHAARRAASEVIGLAILTVTATLAAPHYGIPGMVIAVGVSEAAMLLMNSLALRSRLTE